MIEIPASKVTVTGARLRPKTSVNIYCDTGLGLCVELVAPKKRSSGLLNLGDVRFGFRPITKRIGAMIEGALERHVERVDFIVTNEKVVCRIRIDGKKYEEFIHKQGHWGEGFRSFKRFFEN